MLNLNILKKCIVTKNERVFQVHFYAVCLKEKITLIATRICKLNPLFLFVHFKTFREN